MQNSRRLKETFDYVWTDTHMNFITQTRYLQTWDWVLLFLKWVYGKLESGPSL